MSIPVNQGRRIIADDAPCPICGHDFYEWGYHVCGHLLSTWDYTEECGFWAGAWEVLDGLRRAFGEVIRVRGG